MFNFQTNKLQDTILLDWQITRFCSPVMDLFDVLFTSSDKEFRDKHFHNLIRHYHKTLSESIQRLGSDPEKLISFADLQNQLKKFGKYGLMIGLLTLPLVIPDANEIPGMEIEPENEDDDTPAPYSEAIQAIYHRRVNDFVADVIHLGLYSK